MGSPVPVSPDSSPGCWFGDPKTVQRVGRGITVVNVCFRLKNTTSHPIEIRFPPRLIVISKHTEDQNGVLIDAGQKVVIPAYSMMWVDMALHCLNEKRRATRPDSEYEFGPVTDDPQLTEISEIVQSKDLKDHSSLLLLQQAIWQVTDRGGLTDATRAQLRALPTAGR